MASMQELLSIMRRLRGPGGCPWDQEQTHESLRPYLLEEAAEAVDAITAGETAELAGELGDVLLQVAFHSVIAEENSSFTYADVERHIVDKLVRRHPHVFGDATVADSREVVSTWQAIKAAEHGDRPRRPAQRVPSGLGALSREAQTQRLARHRGTRAEVQAVLNTAPDSGEGIAQVLAAVVAWAGAHGIDAELALREHTQQRLEALPEGGDT